MEKWFVTGGAGGLGLEVSGRILDAGDAVVALDVKPPSHEELQHFNRTERYVFVNGDMRDQGLVAELIRDVDYVVHLAALTIVASRQNPLVALDVNTRAFIALLEIASQMQTLPAVAFASSATLLNGNQTFAILNVERDEPPLTSTSADGTVTFYAATKLFNELVADHWREKGMKIVGLRFGLITFPWGGQGLSRQIVDGLISNPMIGSDSTVPCADDFPNWLSATDAASACCEAARRARHGVGRKVYNALGEFRSMEEAIDLARARFPDAHITGLPGLAGLDQRGFRSDLPELGIRLPISLENQIESLILGRQKSPRNGGWVTRSKQL